MGDEGHGRLEAVGRLTPTVGIEFRRKRIPRGAELIRGRTWKIDEGSRAGSAGGRGGRIPQRRGAESTGQGVEFVKVMRGVVLGFDARKALQIFVQNNDCSGRY